MELFPNSECSTNNDDDLSQYQINGVQSTESTAPTIERYPSMNVSPTSCLKLIVTAMTAVCSCAVRCVQ